MSKYIDTELIEQTLDWVEHIDPIGADAIRLIREDIREMPSVEVKRGRWVKNNEYVYVCSVCGEEALNDEYGEQTLSPYCGACGAEMNGVEE